MARAAKELGLASSQLYNWRVSAAKKADVSDRETALQAEVAKLKRQLAVQAEELAIVKNVWSAPVLQVPLDDVKVFASMYPAYA